MIPSLPVNRAVQLLGAVLLLFAMLTTCCTGCGVAHDGVLRLYWRHHRGNVMPAEQLPWEAFAAGAVLFVVGLRFLCGATDNIRRSAGVAPRGVLGHLRHTLARVASAIRGTGTSPAWLGLYAAAGLLAGGMPVAPFVLVELLNVSTNPNVGQSLRGAAMLAGFATPPVLLSLVALLDIRRGSAWRTLSLLTGLVPGGLLSCFGWGVLFDIAF